MSSDPRDPNKRPPGVPAAPRAVPGRAGDATPPRAGGSAPARPGGSAPSRPGGSAPSRPSATGLRSPSATGLRSPGAPTPPRPSGGAPTTAPPTTAPPSAATRARRPQPATEGHVRPGTIGFQRRGGTGRRWATRIGLGALTLAAVTTVAFVALLHLARLEVLERLRGLGRRTHRTVVVQDVRLGLDGTITLSGLRVSAPDAPGTTALGVDRLTARFDVRSVLFEGGRRPESVVLRGLWADLTVRGGRLVELDELREALGRRSADTASTGRRLPRVELEDATLNVAIHDTPPVPTGFRLSLQHLTGTVASAEGEPRSITVSLQGSTPGPTRRVSFRVSGDVRGGDDPSAEVHLSLDAPFELPPLRGPDGPRVRIGGLALRSGEHVGVTGLEVFAPAKGGVLARILSVRELNVDLRGGLIPRPEDVRAIVARELDATLGDRAAKASLIALELGEAPEAAAGAPGTRTRSGGGGEARTNESGAGEPPSLARVAATLLARATTLRVEQASGRVGGARLDAREATLTFRPGGGDPDALLGRIDHAVMRDVNGEAASGLPRVSAGAIDVRLAGLSLDSPLSSVRRLRLHSARVDVEQPGGLEATGGPLGTVLGALAGEDDAAAEDAVDATLDADEAPRKAPPKKGSPTEPTPARDATSDALDQLIDRLALLDVRVDEGELVVHAHGGGPETIRLSGVDAVVAPGDLPGAMRFDLETHVTEAKEHTTALRVAGSIDAQRRLSALDVSTSGRRLAQLLGKLSPKVHVVPSSELSVTVHLDPTDPEHPRLEGRVAATDLGIDYWRIAHTPVTGLSFEVDFVGDYDRKKDTLSATISKLRLGEAVLSAEATIKRVSGVPDLKLHVAMPKQSCSAVARSIPPAMIPRLAGLTTTGTVWFDLKATIDLRDSYTFKLDLDGDLQSCAVLSVGGDADMDALNKRSYTHHVVINGEDLNTTVGPGSRSFVRLKNLPAYVGWAAIATEDLAFYDHQGFRLNLIKRAVKLDLDYKRYVYGGSTISQQLVKNLFLTREKTLSRKAEEAILTWFMEQRVEKARILELYLNCIEYGPEIWGIKRAAAHYFQKKPENLTPLETAFLMGLKPCPKCGFAQWKAGGLDARWQHRMEHILTRLRDRGWITEEQFEESRPFLPAFFYPDRGMVQLEVPRGSK